MEKTTYKFKITLISINDDNLYLINRYRYSLDGALDLLFQLAQDNRVTKVRIYIRRP